MTPVAYKITACEEEPGYRYALHVRTDADSESGMVVVQCNPSRASGMRSDPTVGKVSKWAEENGFGSVIFLNLFARRSSSVAEIRNLAYSELVGAENDSAIARYGKAGSKLVLAWGRSLPVPESRYVQRLLEVRDLLAGRPLYRVGALVGGRYPRHGRMWNADNRTLAPLAWSEILSIGSHR